MLTLPEVRRYSTQSGLRDMMIAEKEVVLTFLLQLLSERGILNRNNANSGIKEFGTAVGTPQEGGTQDPAASIYLSVTAYYILSKWSGRKDLNLRPPGPEPWQ
jgi:hypothetical protein